MRITIFFVLSFCAMQEVQGSNSTKKRGKSRLKTWIKNGLTVLAANSRMNKIERPMGSGIPKSLEPQLAKTRMTRDAEPQMMKNRNGCKYIVPDQNAEMMMKYIACDKEPEFEKYLTDNSDSCLEVKTLYEKVKNAGNCALNIPKAIVSGALKKFGGQQLNQETNVKMLNEYLAIDSESKSQDFADLGLKENFEFFQFVHLAENTRLYPEEDYSIDMKALKKALNDKIKNIYKEVNADHKFLELTRLGTVKWPEDDRMAAVWKSLGNQSKMDYTERLLDGLYDEMPKHKSWEELKSEFKNVDVKHAKRMLELTRLEYPKDETRAVRMALDDKYKEVDVDHAKRMLELTRLGWPNMAVSMALESKYKDVDVDHAKRMLQLTRLMYPKQEGMAVLMALDKNYKDVNVDNAKRMLELTRQMWPKNEDMAIWEALQSKYKDVNVDKVYEKYQDFKNSWWSWFTYTSDQDHMKKAFKLTHPEVVKEDF